MAGGSYENHLQKYCYKFCYSHRKCENVQNSQSIGKQNTQFLGSSIYNTKDLEPLTLPQENQFLLTARDDFTGPYLGDDDINNKEGNNSENLPNLCPNIDL